MKTDTLNPELYRALSLACQKGPPTGLAGRRVIIRNRGIPMTASYLSDPYSRNVYQPRTKLNVQSFGETYCVCCPFCGDLRHRLWINHRFNTYDPVTKSKQLYLCHCFNEGCERSTGFTDLLLSRIDLVANMLAKPTVPKVVAPTEDQSIAVKLPMNLISLRELDSGHPACVFLRSRGFNPKKLADNFRVMWCPHDPNPNIRHRIVVPVFNQGVCVGYQARYVDSNGSGDCSRLFTCFNRLCGHQWYYPGDTKPVACPACGTNDPPTPVVKWYTGPGTKLGNVALNYDYARTYDFVVVVEGPHDVFRIGTPTKTEVPGPAIALFNHIIGSRRDLIAQTWGSRGPVFLMFDEDVFKKSIAQAIALAPYCPKGVTVVELPDGKDPADMSHAEVWACLTKAAQDAGFPAKYRW